MFNHTRLFTSLLVALSLAWMGCGDDDEKTSTGPSGGGETVTQANVAQVQAALGATIASAAGKGVGKHKGAHSGTVDISISTGKIAQIGGLKMTMKFDNYSDDGKNWIDGTITYEVSGTSVKYTGNITISGTYSGKIEIDVTAGPTGATGTYKVNGQTITIG
jgi:hypothetical protein